MNSDEFSKGYAAAARPGSLRRQTMLRHIDEREHGKLSTSGQLVSPGRHIRLTSGSGRFWIQAAFRFPRFAEEALRFVGAAAEGAGVS